MSVIRFEELEGWQKAKALAVALYQISKDGEFGRDFGLRDQTKKSSCFDRFQYSRRARSEKLISEFIRYLYMAKGSAGEVMTQLIIAEDRLDTSSERSS